MDDPKSVQRKFEAAVKVMRNLPGDGAYELSDDMLVLFYSYYKQATVGPCNTLKPNSWDPIGKAKWEAWKALENMSKDQAMMEYVQEIQMIIETLPVTDRMEELMDALDPFYEIVEEENETVPSKPAKLSTGGISAKEDAVTENSEEDESDSSIENENDTMEAGKDSRDRKNSVSSSTNETHSSLNSEVQEEELVNSRGPSTEPQEFGSFNNYHSDESDDELSSNSMKQQEKNQKGSGVPRVPLAVVSVAGANIKEQQGGNRKAQRGSQDGKPRGVTAPVPHPSALGTGRTERMSQSRGRVETKLRVQSCHGEMVGSKDKQAFNKHIAMTLSELQDNMQDVLQSLTSLENLTTLQIESIPLESTHSSSHKKRLPWWPLDLSPISVVSAITWPFAVHWLMQFYLKKRRR